MKQWIWALLLLVSPLRAAELPELFEIPAFEFTSHAAAKFGKKELLGKVWVADFIFTRCGGQCPILSAKMAELQKTFLPHPDLQLVSFSVDPQNDTPTVLAKYAKTFHAAPAWVFLTGPEKKMASLMRDGFKLGGGGGDEIFHSYRFVLVDRKGMIRGYYTATDAEKFDQLKTDLKALLR